MLLNQVTGLWRRLVSYSRRKQLERELEEEMRFHLELKAEENVAAGMESDEARYAARRQFGNLTLLKQVSHEMWRFMLLETLLQDLRYGLRILLRKPGFTIVAILTLALGIGANTAVFSVVNAVLLRPLPYPQADRLLWIGGWARGVDKEQGVTPADFLDYREQSQSFAQLAASISDSIAMNLSGNGEPERLKGGAVTVNYLDVFGVKAALGRTFTAEEEQEGRDQVVVLSHGLWERRFGADPTILNQTITLDGRPRTVIGVMPPGFQYPPGVEIWQPFIFSASPQNAFRSRELHFLRPVAKLKSGVSLQQAQAEVETIARRLEAQYPKSNTNQSLFLIPLHERLVGNIRLTLLLLLGAIGFVLLIACANVANLLLARAASRQKEIALRAAIGASGWRIVRQMLTESLTLALLGGACCAVLAQGGVDLLLSLSTAGLPRADEIRIDWVVFGFTLGISLATGLLFGLAPALQAARLELTEALREGGMSAGNAPGRNRTRSLLIVSEVALAVVLLIGAGLLINSFARLQRVSPGFDEKNLLTVRVDLPDPFAQPEKKTLFFEQLHQRVAVLPGVESVGMITELPLARQSSDLDFTIEGRAAEASGQKSHADIRNVNHEYFRAMRIPLLAGRNFTEAEVHESARIVVVSEVLSRRYFAGENPIGQRLRLALLSKEPYEVIGVVGDVRHRGLNVDLRETIYFPTLHIGWSNLVIRTATNPAALAAAVRREVTAIDANQPVANIKTMEQWVSESVGQPRFRTLLLGVFSAVALLLSVIGIYGVMSYAVTERTHELGIRMALGAKTRDVVKLVLSLGMTPALIGVVIGLAAALALTRLIRGFLYEVSATDPLTFLLVSLLVVGVALAACFVPARRASRVDPMVALRYE